MRRLLIGLTLVATLWCGWWILGAFTVERSIVGWMEARRAEGWQAEMTELDLTGFPLTWHTTITDFDLQEPATPAHIFADRLRFSAAAYWPFSAKVDFPETPILYETAICTHYLDLTNGSALAEFTPSLPLTLSNLSLTSDTWQLNTPKGNVLSGTSLAAKVAQTQAQDTYLITLDAAAFTPGDVVRQQLDLPTNWPRAFDRFTAQLTARIDPQATRSTPQNPAATLRQLDVVDIEMIWAQTRLSATGGITIDATGQANGNFTLLIKNWRELYEIAKQSGTLQPEIHLQYDLMLNALANIGGDPETLDLTLSFKDDTLFLGPISLGPAPRILF